MNRPNQGVLYRIALIVVWLATTGIMVVMLLHDVRSTGQYSVVRHVLQVAYVSVLLWYLCRTGPSIRELPDIRPLLFQLLLVGNNLQFCQS